MNLVKKWAGCVVSFFAGVCGLLLSLTVGMKASALIDASALESMLGFDASQKVKTTTKAFKVLTDGDLYTEAKELGIGSEFMVMKIFAIITLLVSVLLIAYGVVLLLKNLNQIKLDCKITTIAGICLFALLLVATIGLLVASNNYANAMEDAMLSTMKALFGAELSAVLAPEMVASILAQIGFSINVSVGVYQPAMLVISIICALAFGVVTFMNMKKKKA